MFILWRPPVTPTFDQVMRLKEDAQDIDISKDNDMVNLEKSFL